MKKTIVQLTLRALFVGVAFFAFVPLASAHSFTQQAQSQAPMQFCSGEQCDHAEPPPISSCNNDGTLNTKTIYDNTKPAIAIGQLNLFHDESICYTFWAGLKDINAQDGSGCFTITNLQVFETNLDQSAQGAVDSIPHLMCSVGQWESTKMNGWDFNPPLINSSSNYATSTVTDQFGNTNDKTSTKIETCSTAPNGIFCTHN